MRWIIPVLLVVGLLWLSGPGLRFFAPRVALHFLEKAGLRGDFTVEGNIVGGIVISNLKIAGDRDFAGLSIDRLVPKYRLERLLKGQLESLTVEGVHLDLRVGLKKLDAPEKPPFVLGKLLETLRTVRERVVPLAVEVKNFSLSATRDEQPYLRLAPSSIYHSASSSEFVLTLGTLTDADGREWPAQNSTILWTAEKFSIARIDPLPGISLREFNLRLPATGEPSLDSLVYLDEAVLVLNTTPGFTSAKLDLREGKLQLDETAKRLGITFPVSATLTSLALEIDDFLPRPRATTGSIRLLVENIGWQDWQASELSLDATLAAGDITMRAQSFLLGRGISLEAKAPLSRGDQSFSLGEVRGKLAIADVPPVLSALSARVPALDPLAAVPASTLDGNFTLFLTDSKITAATAALLLKPMDEKLATSAAVDVRWATGQPLTADAVLDGLRATASYDIQSAIYQATLALDQFTSRRVEPWLAAVKVTLAGNAALTGKWAGSGEVRAGKHRGEFSLTQASWSRPDAAAINASGGVTYDWPARFDTQGLQVQINDQTLALEASLTAGRLELQKLLWTRNKEELAVGSASLPVPTDFAKWRDTLAKDMRPVAVSVQSRVLSLALLKPWIPTLEKLDPRSTGQLTVQVAGTYAEPVIEAKFEARDLRAPSQPKLPPADLKIEIIGREGRLTVKGEATAPDFPAAVMTAEMPFLPAAWAQEPSLVAQETVRARVDLPRLDLSRFSSLVPAAEQLSGIVTGNIVVAGKVSQPVIKGTLDLAAGSLRLKGGKIPPIEEVTATMELAPERVVLKSLKASVSGGSLRAEGTVAISAGKLAEIQLKLRGDHLPILRNDSLILRANANLNLQGTVENATLAGTIGAVDSIFFRDIEILPIGQPFTGPGAATLPKIDPPRAVASAIPAPFRNWRLALTVRTEDPLIIRGNLAKGEISGSVRVGGTLGTPLPDGKFTIKDLSASLPFSTLQVPRGLVIFTPASGFDPILEIRGTAEPRPYQVTIYAYGPLSNPQLVLTSNPPLPENEIMTLLATGTTTSGLEDPATASSRALQLLAEELRRGRFRFGKQLRPLLALADKVDFSLEEADPYSSETFSTATIALTDRWFISAGIGARGDSRTMLVWRVRFR